MSQLAMKPVPKVRLIDVETYCRERDLPYFGSGGGFIAETRDVQVFGVGFLAQGDDCMVRNLSSANYAQNIAVQMEKYAVPEGDGISLNIPTGGKVDEATLLWGQNNFGHWIFTYLNRLPILFRKPELLDKPLLVLDGMPSSFYEWLGLMGFNNYILAKDGVRVSKLWVPSVAHYRDTIHSAKVCPNAVHLFRHLLVKHSGGNERIYISRARASWRRVTNEDALVSHLATHGIRRVFMEDMSAAEQIDLVGRCELIVSVTGAASPITMLAPRNCKIVEIGLPGFCGVFGSQAWSRILGQPFRRIHASPVSLGMNSDIEVSLDALGDVGSVLRSA